MSVPIYLSPVRLEDAQVVNLWMDGRSVAGVSGTVGSVPSSLRRLLERRPELVNAVLEVTTVLEPLNDYGCAVGEGGDGI